jgi:cysteinyl-tRNA synthetase
MLTIFNTLTRKLEEFAPLAPPVVNMYTCGPTVYDFAHIGNFRAYIFEDILRRYLKFSGFRVKQVMNLTDVDDKTIRGARQARISLDEFTRRYKEAFFADLDLLNIERAEYYPAATAHIAEMISLVKTLMDKGYAYAAADGSVYFSIAKFKNYGRLAHLDMAGLKPGARVALDEYEKEDVADFALWKARQEEDGDVGWDSPWGRGRPGWHIECSAMSMKYLGESFDLHTGGVDNIFPHHEDEIAQSEAATGKQFVKYWMHCAHLVVDGRKMSKSSGNFYTLRDIIKKGYSGREIRYVLLAGHYRQALNFTFAALAAARSSLQRLDEFKERLLEIVEKHNNSAGPEALALPVTKNTEKGRATASLPCRLNSKESYVLNAGNPAWIEKCLSDFRVAMDEDLNLPVALSAVFDMVHEGNKIMDEERLTPSDARQAVDVLESIDRVLGVLHSDEEQPAAELVALAQNRQKARLAKDWKESDRLRKLIEVKGWMVQDTVEGFKLKRRTDVRLQTSDHRLLDSEKV